VGPKGPTAKTQARSVGELAIQIEIANKNQDELGSFANSVGRTYSRPEYVSRKASPSRQVATLADGVPVFPQNRTKHDDVAK